MLLFAFLLLPLLLASFCFYYRKKKIVPIIMIGAVAGILVCAFKTFFLFSHRIVPYSFKDNMLFLLFREALIPVIVLYVLFCAFSKDELQFKVEAYFPLMLSFFSVYLPYRIISSSEGLYSVYSLFIKPFVFGAMLVQTSILLRYAYKNFLNKKVYFSVLFIVLAIGYLFLPSMFEAMYIIKSQVYLSILYSVIYCIIPVSLIVLTELRILERDR